MGWWMGRLGFALALGCALGQVGCGSSGGTGDNDQGIVFRATGIVRGPESIDQGQIRCTEPTTTNAIQDNAFDVHIASMVNFPNRNDPFGNPCGGFIGLENNLLQMSIRVTEVAIRYEIPGAGIPIPTNSVSFGTVVLPLGSLNVSPSGQTNLVYAQLVGQILPSNLVVFLNQNVNRLPVTPYLINVFLVAKGVADNGTTYESNEIGYTLTALGD